MTILLVPAKGYTFGGLQVVGATVFGVVGPIPPGVWISRIHFGFSGSGVGTVLAGFALCPGGDATAANYQAGSSLLSDSRIPSEQKPALEFAVSAGSVQAQVIGVGRRLVSGAQFVVCAFSETGGAGAALGNFSVEIVGLTDAVPGRAPDGVTVETVLA